MLNKYDLENKSPFVCNLHICRLRNDAFEVNTEWKSKWKSTVNIWIIYQTLLNCIFKCEKPLSRLDTTKLILLRIDATNTRNIFNNLYSFCMWKLKSKSKSLRTTWIIETKAPASIDEHNNNNNSNEKKNEQKREQKTFWTRWPRTKNSFSSGTQTILSHMVAGWLVVCKRAHAWPF